MFELPERYRCLQADARQLATSVEERAAVADESAGEVIQQFGVRGPLAHRAEVVDRADQSPAEDVVPDPVEADLYPL